MIETIFRAQLRAKLNKQDRVVTYLLGIEPLSEKCTEVVGCR